MMMWSVTQSQTCWSVKSSRPEEALLSTKLVDEMESSRAIHNLKDDALKCCTQYVSKSARPSRGPRTGRGQFSTQFPRRAVLKNVHTIGQLHSSPMQMLRLDLEKAEEPEVKVPTSIGS